MLVKFFAGGTGKGKSPVEYLVREKDAKGVIRDPLPEVIKGNPNQTIKLIDSLDFKYKFHSGVISFAPEDVPTEEQQGAIIDSFEATAFPGLDQNQYDILWVKHNHTTEGGRVELHFVTPRVELTTGKSLSIAPPGWQEYFCHWRDSWNLRHDWADPSDPARERTYQPGYQALRDAQDKRLELSGLPAKSQKEDYRKVITNYLTQQIELGNIKSREDIISNLQNVDIEITRQGKEYITVTSEEIGQRIRLKGGIYSESWRPEQEITTTTERGQRAKTRDTDKRIKEAKAKLEERISKRIELFSARYPSNPAAESQIDKAMQYLARDSAPELLRHFLDRKLGNDAISCQTSSGDRFKQANIEGADQRNMGRGASSDREREIYYSSTKQPGTNRMALSGQTLYKDLSEKDDQSRETAITDFQELQSAIRAGQEAAIRNNRELVRAGERLEQNNKRLKQRGREIKQSLWRHPENLRKIELNRNEELERFKSEINLADYALNKGYELDKKKSSINCMVLKDSQGDKMLVGLDKSDNHYFYSSLTNPSDKGSIIDFVQNRQNLNLGEVRKELRPWVQTSHKTNSKTINKSETKLKPIDKNRQQILIALEEVKTVSNYSYLNNRGIRKTTVNNPRFKDTIYQDKRNNLVFPHKDQEGACGYELRNRDFQGFSSGGVRGLWASRGKSSDSKLVICESPIDCLSYHELFPDDQTSYVSTSGSLSESQKKLLQSAFEKIIQKGGEIIIATDNDEAGSKIARQLIEIAPKKAEVFTHIPKQEKDWNNALQVEIQQEKILQQQKTDREKKVDRGISR